MKKPVMPIRKSDRGAANVGASTRDALREDAHPSKPSRETKQPYATELDDYHGEKAKPPEEGPTIAPEK